MLCKTGKFIKCGLCCILFVGLVIYAAKNGLFDKRTIKRKLKRKIDCLEEALECADDLISDM